MLSKKSIDTISNLEVNRTYKIAIDDKGEVASLETIGTGKVVKGRRVEPIAHGSVDKLLEQYLLESVGKGSMVIALGGKNGVISPSSVLGFGFIKYAKATTGAFYSIESLVKALNELKKTVADEDFLFAVRYKRRTNRWEVHVGMYVPSETLTDYVPHKENPFRAYNLATRSHVWAEEGGAE